MKRRNVILTILFAAVCAKGANASANATEIAPDTIAQEEAKLNEVQLLIEKLNGAHALESDENGNVHVKPSVLDKLRENGRADVVAAIGGGICD